MNYRMLFSLLFIVASGYAADSEYAPESAYNMPNSWRDSAFNLPLSINIKSFSTIENFKKNAPNRIIKIPISKRTTSLDLQNALREATNSAGILYRSEVKVEELPQKTLAELLRSYKYDFNRLEADLLFATEPAVAKYIDS